MMNHKEVEDIILKLDNTWLDFPFGEGTSVYKVGDKSTGEGKIFAIIADHSKPLKISLKCDPLLAQKLRDTYESVLPGYHLNKKHWNTILATGQIPNEELVGLINHSYQLVSS